MSFPYTPCIPMQIKPIKACQGKHLHSSPLEKMAKKLRGALHLRERVCHPFSSTGLGSPCELVSSRPQHLGHCLPVITSDLAGIQLSVMPCIFLFSIEIIGVVLANQIMQVSGSQFYNASSVLCVVCSFPQVQSPRLGFVNWKLQLRKMSPLIFFYIYQTYFICHKLF